MDIFCEQLVKIKNSAAKYFLMGLIILAAAAVCALLFYYSIKYYILIFLIVAIFYGVIKLLGFFFTEYEYIITNGTVDIDKIFAKSRRKRVISFETADIIRTAKSNDTGVASAVDKVFVCGNKSGNAYYVLAKKGAAKIAVLLEPNEKFKNAIIESAPRTMKRDLFI